MKWSSLLLIPPCIFVVFAMLCDLTIGTKIEPYQAGVCKMGEDDTVLTPMSYMGCIEECRARPQCLSINVYPRMSLCRLNFNESLTLKNCDFFAYSEKSSWIKKTKDGCESINCSQNQKCQMTKSGAVCVNSECRRVTHIQNGFVYGNDVRKGMRIAFGCRRGYSLIGRSPVTCMDDGFWSDDIPVCSGGAATNTLNSSSAVTTPTATPELTDTIQDKSSDETTSSPKTWLNTSVNANQSLADNDQHTFTDATNMPPHNQSNSSDATKTETNSVPNTTSVSTLTSKEDSGINEDFVFDINRETSPNGPYQSSTSSPRDSAVHIADTTTEIFQTQVSFAPEDSAVHIADTTTEIFQTQVSFVPEATQSIDLDQEPTSISTFSKDMTGGFSDSTTSEEQAWPSPKLLQTDMKTSTALVDLATPKALQLSTAVLTTSTETASASVTTTSRPHSTTAISTTSTAFKVFRYADPCNMPGVCNRGQFECRDGFCQCYGMLVFEPTYQICVTGCFSYGSSYEKYSHQTFEVDDDVIQEIITYTLPECFDICETLSDCNVIWTHRLVAPPAYMCRFYFIPSLQITLSDEEESYVYLRNCEMRNSGKP